METKRCSKCKEIKPISEFYKISRNKNGLSYNCKSCTKILQSIYENKRDKDKIKDKRKILFLLSNKYEPEENCISLNDLSLINKSLSHFKDNLNVKNESLERELLKIINTLPSREAKIIERYYGLSENQAETLHQIGEDLKITRERVRQIRDKALRRLRHPSRARRIKNYIEEIRYGK